MQIAYTCHGGFVPQALGCKIDTETLSPEESAAVNEMVDSSGFFDLTVLPIPVYDSPINVIRVTTESQTRQMSIPTALVPESLRPLIAWLRSRSTDLLEDRGAGG
jgi:hypothetical protein